MPWINRYATAVVACVVAGFATAAGAQSVTAYEGARLITGDGRVVEKGVLVIDGARIAAAGAAGKVQVPDGARRVNVAGKTVMPMIIDTHVHLSPQRDAIVRDLKLRAYYGVSVVLSMGTDSPHRIDDSRSAID
jgi:imidazolonepropionase-like amidohydrolase